MIYVALVTLHGTNALQGFIENKFRVFSDPEKVFKLHFDFRQWLLIKYVLTMTNSILLTE